MNFSELSLGSCFRIGRGKAVHQKTSHGTYLRDGEGPEVYVKRRMRVKESGCPIEGRRIIELGDQGKKD